MPVITFLQAMSLVMTVGFLSYVTMIVIPYLRRHDEPTGDAGRFVWHVFVPCRDEAAVIVETLHRLATSFPACHVWVVDDDSDDGTAALVQAAAAEDDHVHLVHRRRPHARTGKGDALNSAYRALCGFLPEQLDHSRVIVCVLDADGELDPRAFDFMAGPRVFGDPLIGAAQASVIMRNRDQTWPVPHGGPVANAWSRYLVRMQDLEFRAAIAAMQTLRERTNSVGLGGNGQFTRLSVLDEIGRRHGAPWHGALLEDYELGVHVLLSGYKNRYVNATWVSQEALPSLRALIRQRTRWSQGNMQCIAYLRQILRSSHFSNAGATEATYFLLLPFLQVAGLIVWPAVTYVALRQLAAQVQGPGGAAAEMWYLALVAVFGVGPFVLWGPIYRLRCEPDTSKLRALLWGIGYWLYVYYMYVSATQGLIRLIRGRTGWEKTRRNAELVGSRESAVPSPRIEEAIEHAGHGRSDGV